MTGTERSASPPTARVVRLLEHLAQRPHEARSVSQLARELAMPRATCALIVDELVGLGWLAADRDGVVLGTGPIPIGRAALASPGSATIAHDALVALEHDLGVACTTSAVIGGDIVVLERIGPPAAGGLDLRVGSRFPFSPPIGVMNIAWDPDDAIEAWMARSPWPLPAEHVARLWEAVHDMRRHGVLVERLSEHLPLAYALLAGIMSDELPHALRRVVGDVLYPLAGRDYLHAELRAGHDYPVNIVAAPVFDDAGRQRFLIGAFLADQAVPHARIVAVAERVRAAADTVTAALGGHDPWRDTP